MLVDMDWTTALIVAGAIAAWLLLKRSGLISAEKARDLLRQGAPVIDVRSRNEFAAGHLSKAINVPLGELAAQAGQVAPDKHQPLLLHCLSGGRSGVGKMILRRQGYTKVYNLGSYRRAEKILKAATEG